MGGVAVIHPQDCLKQPFSSQDHFFSGCMKPSRNTPNRANRRKKSPSGSSDQGTVRSRPLSVPKKTTVNKIISPNDIVTGRVKILKRGEPLTQPPESHRVSDVVKFETATSDLASDVVEAETAASDLASDVVKVETAASDPASDIVEAEIVNSLTMTDRLGPDPEMLTEQIRVFGGFYAGSAIIVSPPPSSLPLPSFFSKSDVIVNNKHATNDLLRMLRLNLA